MDRRGTGLSDPAAQLPTLEERIDDARAVRDAIGNLGIRIRAGLHTGECELVGDQIGGIAVHIGARVASKADPDEILVSNTVKDLVIGSGLHFSDRGSHALKGVPGEWRLFAADV